jgi:hypothetical protein
MQKGSYNKPCFNVVRLISYLHTIRDKDSISSTRNLVIRLGVWTTRLAFLVDCIPGTGSCAWGLGLVFWPIGGGVAISCAQNTSSGCLPASLILCSVVAGGCALPLFLCSVGAGSSGSLGEAPTPPMLLPLPSFKSQDNCLPFPL